MKGCVQASKPLSVFALCERKPRSGLPSWLANALEVAIAVLTVTVRSLGGHAHPHVWVRSPCSRGDENLWMGLP